MSPPRVPAGLGRLPLTATLRAPASADSETVEPGQESRRRRDRSRKRCSCCAGTGVGHIDQERRPPICCRAAETEEKTAMAHQAQRGPPGMIAAPRPGVPASRDQRTKTGRETAEPLARPARMRSDRKARSTGIREQVVSEPSACGQRPDRVGSLVCSWTEKCRKTGRHPSRRRGTPAPHAARGRDAERQRARPATDQDAHCSLVLHGRSGQRRERRADTHIIVPFLGQAGSGSAAHGRAMVCSPCIVADHGRCAAAGLRGRRRADDAGTRIVRAGQSRRRHTAAA